MGTSVATKPANAVAAKPEEKPTETLVEYVPFMADEAIKLSVTIIQNFICVKTKSGKVCDNVQAMKFMALCKARKLNPFEGDCFLIGYDGRDGEPPNFSLITAHQAFLKRAECHNEYDGMKSGVIVKNKTSGEIVDREGDFYFDEDILLGAWATVYFKKRTHPMHKRIKLQTFSKGFGRWKDDPGGMIVKCAEADALRSSFPTQLGGMYTGEEMGAAQRTFTDHVDYHPTDRVVSKAAKDSDVNSKLEAMKKQPALPAPAPNPPAPETVVDDQPEHQDEPEAESEQSQEPAGPTNWRDVTVESLKDKIGAVATAALIKRDITDCGKLAELLNNSIPVKASEILSPPEAKKCRAVLDLFDES